MVHHFKFRTDIRTVNLSGMGCAASIIAIDWARDMLAVRNSSLLQHELVGFKMIDDLVLDRRLNVYVHESSPGQETFEICDHHDVWLGMR